MRYGERDERFFSLRLRGAAPAGGGFAVSEMNVPFLDLAVADAAVRGDIKRALAAVADSGSYVLGPEVEKFENRFAEFAGAKHAVCVNSGTSALQLAYLAAGVGAGDEVIVPAMTFIATAMAATYIGAKPVCVDVDGFCAMNPEAVESAITPKTKAIAPVHLYGQPADMDAVTQIAERNGIPVIEDAAQAHGAEYRGRRCGGMGLAAAWSFYPGKNLGALGEGGAVTTNDPAVAEKCRMLRDWGQSAKGVHSEKGFNYRMDALQGAVLGVKLGQAERWADLRAGAASRYRELLSGSAAGLQELRPDCRHVWHVFAVMVDGRDRIAARMRERGVGVGVHYPSPVHLHPCYKDLGYKRGDFPVAEKIADTELSLPMFPGITGEQIRYVSDVLLEAVEEAGR